MKPLSSREIRETFLDFFISRDHRRIEGSSLLPRNDPTLLYINSGMAPLKRLFTGEETPPHPDLCNVQPCIRTIDIDDVGDRHHLTLFEMMGSWSIGRYFKEHAIELAYELLVDRLGFPADRLYATYFSGDASIDLPGDEVSAGVWERVGMAREQIIGLGLDNFWGPAGDTGPCGPCTEVFFDTGERFGPTWKPGMEFDTSGRYIEIWNAGVFMEYDKRPDGSFPKLPFPSVDTGSGLERMTMAMGGLDSVYDTDLLAPLVERIGEGFGNHQVPIEQRRLLADHLRASTFILAEGVRPSNVDAGYIPRRLIRKSIAVAHRVGARDYDFESVLDLVIGTFAEYYPRLNQQRDTIIARFREERSEFDRVISRGLEQLDRLIGTPPFMITGHDAFTLFATYGLPVDIVRDFAAERGGSVDDAAFEREFREHQEVSRVLRRRTTRDGGSVVDWPRDEARLAALFERVPVTEFSGYEATSDRSPVLALLRDGQVVDAVEEGERVEVICARTPFYAESGGQVGDTGRLRADGSELTVLDTQRSAHGYHLHRATVDRGRLRTGDVVELEVDEERRDNLRRNHSATHLLQAVLRDLLGDHVHQAGSLVEPARLRFDFTHTGALTREQVYEVERALNRTIFSDLGQSTALKPMAEAVREGALYMAGEDYGDRVRVVDFGGYSVELCGGTHVRATGDINLFRVMSETSIASGVRRIVAVTGEAAVDYTLHRDAILSQVATQLRVGADDVAERVEKLASGARKRPASGAQVDAGALRRGVLPDGTAWAAGVSTGDTNGLRTQAADLAASTGGVVVLGADDEGTARVCVAVARGLEGRHDAGVIIRALLPVVEGRGGGKPGMATGGGPKVERLGELMAKVESVLAD
ncbi:MAG: alanine--tRNA ligase [Candidatus Dormibacteria bacterium]